MKPGLDLKRRIAILVATAMLPVIGLSVYKSWRDVSNQVESAKESMRVAASLAAAHQGGLADSARQLLGSIASNEAVTGNDNGKCSQLLANLNKAFPAYTNIGITERSGRIQCDSAKSNGNVFIGDRRYFREAVANEAFTLGEYSLGRVSGMPVLVFAYPWKDERGAIGGVIFASLSLMELLKDIGDTALPAGGRLTVFDRNGVILSTNEPGLTAGFQEKGTAILDAMRSGKTVSGEISDGRSDRIFGLAPLPGAGQSALFVRTSIDRDLAVSTAGEVLTHQVAVVLLATLIGSVAAWTFGGRAIVAPADAESARTLAEIRQLNTGLEEKIAARTVELQQSNDELKAFSYSLSHDLRSPLKVIDGFAHLLDKRLAITEDAKVKDYLSRIKAAVAQMDELIEGMLELNRVSHINLQRQDVDLSALATDVLAQLQAQDPQRAVLAAVAEGLHVNGDPRLLRAVMENLIGNAWKFTAKQPRTEISFGSKTDDGGRRVFYVRDNGAGFDMNYSEKLFKAFERMHSAAEFPGTGVGLATVARVIARHGGHIWAESAPGEGATFFWTICELQEESTM